MFLKLSYQKKIIFNNRELQRKIQKMHISVSLLYILTISISTVLLRAKYSQMLWHNQDQNYYPLVPRYIRSTRYVFIFVCDEKLEKLVNLRPQIIYPETKRYLECKSCVIHFHKIEAGKPTWEL